MTLRTGLLAGVLAGSLGVVAAQGPSTAAVPQPGPAARVAGADASGSVTLLTGDKVVVSGRGYKVEPAPGRQVR